MAKKKSVDDNLAEMIADPNITPEMRFKLVEMRLDADTKRKQAFHERAARRLRNKEERAMEKRERALVRLEEEPAVPLGERVRQQLEELKVKQNVEVTQ